MVDLIEKKTENIDSEKSDLKKNTENKLSELKNIVLDNNFFTEIKKIKDSKEFEDPKLKPDLSKLIEKGDYMGAINETFRLIGSLFGTKTLEGPYDRFDKTGKTIDRSNMDMEKLLAHVKYLEEDIAKTNGILRKLHITKILSDLKNTITVKNKNDKKIDNYDILADNVKPGQILLLNKKSDNSYGANLLRSYQSDNPVDFTHSVLVSENKNGEIMIIHSTIKKESGEGSGVEEIPLKDYLKKHKPIDILALDQTSEMNKKSLEFAREKIGKGYDNKAAISTGLGKNWLSNSMIGDTSQNENYNCVELIAQAYKDNEQIKKITHPNDFLDYGIFTPSYIGKLE